MPPSKVTKSNEVALLKSVYSHLKIAGSRKFKVGDVVRISKAKHIFEKGYTSNYTTELFKIISVAITNLTTYLLEDRSGREIKGYFYQYELTKATITNIYLVEKVLQEKGNKVKVLWLGFDELHDS